jgi:hypothetical protein
MTSAHSMLQSAWCTTVEQEIPSGLFVSDVLHVPILACAAVYTRLSRRGARRAIHVFCVTLKLL